MSNIEKLKAGIAIMLLVLLVAVAGSAFDATKKMAAKPCIERGGIPVFGGSNHDELVNCLDAKK